MQPPIAARTIHSYVTIARQRLLPSNHQSQARLYTSVTFTENGPGKVCQGPQTWSDADVILDLLWTTP